MADFTVDTQDAQTTAQVLNKDLPEWYQDYTRNLAGAGANLAENLAGQPLPAKSVAGFNADQTDAFALNRTNVGSWQPQLTAAQNAAGAIQPGVSSLVSQAQGAVAGPTTNWPSNYAQYMSPYTQAVVDNIARLGQRNFNENIMPGVNSSMIGAGQFGSTRNADVLSRAARDASADITGQQAAALHAGYTSSADIFNKDAARAQAQQGLQANTALAGASTTANALHGAGALQGNLAAAQQELQGVDATRLMQQGTVQQGLDQGALTTAYDNAMTARTDPWTQLQNAQGLTSNVQLPSTQINLTNAPSGTYEPSAAAGLSTAFSYLNGTQPVKRGGLIRAPQRRLAGRI